jgi:ribose transport system permease protein
VTSQGSTGVEVGNVRPARKGRRKRSNRTVNIERIALPLFWIIEIAIFGSIKPHLFLTTSNFSSIFGSQAVVAVLALAVLAPALSGDYDLSCASNLVLSSMLVAILTVNDHWPLAAAAAISIITGTFVGLVNGWLVTEFQIESLIVTLGTGTVVQGIVIWISNSATISGVSPGLVNATISDKLFGIPYEFYYVVALALVMWYVFEFTPLGRRLLFVGRGRDVARLSGLRVERLRMGALGASGLVSALAGILYAGSTGSADPSSGLQFLLPAFAAVVLGATSIQPGKFNPWGTLIAIYFLVTGITGLELLGVDPSVQDVFYGGALVLAVVLSQIARRQRLMVRRN